MRSVGDWDGVRVWVHMESIPIDALTGAYTSLYHRDAVDLDVADVWAPLLSSKLVAIVDWVMVWVFGVISLPPC